MSKNQTEFENRQRATLNKIYLRSCKVCGVECLMTKNQKYCTEKCKGKVQYINGKASTEEQYKKISGNWSKYLQKLLYFHGRYKDGLNLDDLLEIAKKQKYVCALSGVPLTCLREKGKVFKTNASIDRINAGGPYKKDNIQLVCKAINCFRTDLSVEEFVEWCKKVAKYNER